jgi:hypothetical protein
MAFTDSGTGYGAGGMAGPRDRITQALMQVQNPPPTPDMPQMPPPPPPPGMGTPGMGGGAGAPPPGAPPMMGAPGAPGMQGAPPMLPQLGAATLPGTQPGGMLAQQQPAPGQPPRPY